ncbi:hypothetical protein SCHPADRAFT_692148 [Schizopora paradoxa]|uniref:Uncharacterized protein n=1 Tax=Schizopora paradoxa TaxID=27342 RepID=A0A0H2R4W3_9AGAM|nr:hypothetical protein SCHPADRAFT_692148 [Schizopora paradoxa]
MPTQMDSNIVERSNSDFVGPAKNRTPCAACREQHKKCDTSKGFPCMGCKSNTQKASACRPTTTPSKSITPPASAESGSDQTFFTATRTSALTPELEPPMVPVQADISQLHSNEDKNLQGLFMPQAFHQQYLPFYEPDRQVISNTGLGDILPCGDNLAFFGTAPVRNVQLFPGFAGILAESTMNTGMEYVQGHDSFFVTYNGQVSIILIYSLTSLILPLFRQRSRQVASLTSTPSTSRTVRHSNFERALMKNWTGQPRTCVDTDVMNSLPCYNDVSFVLLKK